MQTIFNTPEEMTVHLAALRTIAEADGVVTDAERHYLENLALIYSTRFPMLAVRTDLAAAGDLDSLLSVIESRTAKFTLLQDLLSMAFVDGNLAEEELVEIKNIAARIGILPAELEQLFILNQELLDANHHLSEFLFSS